jgi:hypothetical protein
MWPFNKKIHPCQAIIPVQTIFGNGINETSLSQAYDFLITSLEQRLGVCHLDSSKQRQNIRDITDLSAEISRLAVHYTDAPAVFSQERTAQIYNFLEKAVEYTQETGYSPFVQERLEQFRETIAASKDCRETRQVLDRLLLRCRSSAA